MVEDANGVVRRFNRTVTERIGVLEETYLDRGRPLAETRMLWEIGTDGADVRDLRARLGLDSGYASRLLRSLEMRGLVKLAAGEGDRRVRRATLTPFGHRERAAIDTLSDELVGTMLEPLTERQRTRLAEAMDEVERLLRGTMVVFEPADATAAESLRCVREYYAELSRRFRTGFDPEVTLPADAAAMTPPRGLFVVARLRGRAIGCAGLKYHADGVAELKRLWLDPECRGLGVGRRFLADLEQRAADAGSRVVRLDTNRALVEAVGMYRATGYREIPAFTDEPYADYWFEKQLKG